VAASPGALARLQQALTLGALGLGALWWLVWQRQGEPVWAWGGVVLLATGHALVLGLEFIGLALAHGDDPAPRARAAQLLRAWWGESLSAPRVFCWSQPFRSQAVPDGLPAAAEPIRGRTGVLLVHGYVCNRGLWNDWLRRLRAQGVPFVAVNLEPVFGGIEAYASRIEAAVQELEAATGRAPVAVCHSMGGLALRAWWAQDGRDGRLAHAITLGTPHHGTWLARLAFSRNARQMRRDSRWLQALAARETPARRARFTCFYSHADNIVFPASTATLPGADNRHLEAVAHVHMVQHPAPWAALQALLNPR
jgi:triacylglycerol lipase